MFAQIRVALRSLSQAPGFTAVCVLTLALGIGANTAIFSVVDSLLLRRLPYPHSEQLVIPSGSSPKRGIPKGGPVSVPAYEYFRGHNHVFSSFAGYGADTLNLTGIEQPEQVTASIVTSSFLETLGIQPALGRNFLPEEDRPGGSLAVLLGQPLWIRRFGGDPSIVGQAITLNDKSYAVIGIMPANFDLPYPKTDVWVANLESMSMFTPQQMRLGAGFVGLLARMNPGVGAGQAAAELTALGHEYDHLNPGMVDADPDRRMDAVPLEEQQVSGFRTQLLMLSAAVGFVLLIACANVAALMLARAAARGREIAIRAALGAGRSRLMGHLLAESAVLSLAGGSLGVLLAWWGTSALARVAQSGALDVRRIHWDGRVLIFSAGISLATGVLFGLMPALHVSTPNLYTILREGERGSGGSARPRLRSLLVVGQVALSVLLLIGAGLLLRSFVALRGLDPGFDPRNVLSLRVSLPSSHYPTDARRTQFFDQALEAIRTVPGVLSAGAALGAPMTARLFAPFQPSDRPRLPFAQRPIALWQAATPGYLETLRLHLLRGRTFTERDKDGAPLVAVINQTMAQRYWPSQNPMGKHLLVARAELDTEIVGVVSDVREAGFAMPATPEIYMPYAQRTWPRMGILVHTSGDPMLLANAVRARIARIDPDEPVTEITTAERLISDTFGERRLTLSLIGVFAAVALLLAAVGLYGVIAYSVAQRTQEIGVRNALGASFAQICTLILAEGLKLAGLGIAAGVAGALALTRLSSKLLFGVKATDPAVFAGAAVVFLMVSLGASYLPARRAAKVDPVIALRCE